MAAKPMVLDFKGVNKLAGRQGIEFSRAITYSHSVTVQIEFFVKKKTHGLILDRDHFHVGQLEELVERREITPQQRRFLEGAAPKIARFLGVLVVEREKMRQNIIELAETMIRSPDAPIIRILEDLRKKIQTLKEIQYHEI